MKLVIFDIDGTLTNTNEIDRIAYVEAFEALYSRRLSEEDWHDAMHFTDLAIFIEQFERTFNRLPLEGEVKKIQDYIESAYTRTLQEKPELFKEIPGAVALFNELKAHPDYKVAIATGCWSFSAHFKLKAAGVDFTNVPLANSDHHVTREDITRDAIRLSKEHYGVNEFERIIYIGDGAWDYRTTQNLGIPLIGIDVNKSGKLQGLGARFVIDNYADKEAFYKFLDVAEV